MDDSKLAEIIITVEILMPFILIFGVIYLIYRLV